MSDKDIYVLGHELGPAKIGRSIDPEARLKKVQRMCPFEVGLYTTIEAIDANDHRGLSVEKGLHKYFTPCQKRGEWFDLPREELVALKVVDSISDREIATVNYDLHARFDIGSDQTILGDLNDARIHIKDGEVDGL